MKTLLLVFLLSVSNLTFANVLKGLDFETIDISEIQELEVNNFIKNFHSSFINFDKLMSQFINDYDSQTLFYTSFENQNSLYLLKEWAIFNLHHTLNLAISYNTDQDEIYTQFKIHLKKHERFLKYLKLKDIQLLNRIFKLHHKSLDSTLNDEIIIRKIEELKKH